MKWEILKVAENVSIYIEIIKIQVFLKNGKNRHEKGLNVQNNMSLRNVQSDNSF